VNTREFPFDAPRADHWMPEQGSPAYLRDYSLGALIKLVGGRVDVDAGSLVEIETRLRAMMEMMEFRRRIKVPEPVLSREQMRKKRKQKRHWAGSKMCNAVKNPKVVRVWPLMDDEEFGNAIYDETIDTCTSCANQYLNR
jgi:hypothetical protein